MSKHTCSRSGRWSLSFLTLVFLLLLQVPIMHGQSSSGRLNGRVADPSGGVLPGATVTLTRIDTGTAKTAQTNGAGQYSFLEVPVGVYSVQVELTGFKTFTDKQVTISLNQTVTYDVKLEIGQSTQQVEVTGEAPLLDTTSTQLGAVVNERAVANLPLNSRDTYQLLQLQPGVQGVGGSDLFYGSDKAGAVSVNGGRGRSNNFSVNGGDGNDLFVNSPGIEPSPDAVEEFRVITNTFDAEYGRNSGAVINVVTKSGTNAFHGSMYEYFRNKSLDSKGYFNVFTPDDTQNQFGATIGGPIRKDKTFFFLSYEGRQLRQGVSADPVQVPTAQELNGGGVIPGGGSLSDLTFTSILQNRPGCAGAIGTLPGAQGLPTTQQLAATGPVPWTQVLGAGNAVPVACYDPVALNLVRNYVPAANNGSSDTYYAEPNAHSRDNQGTLRFDHKFSDRNSLSAFYYVDENFTADPYTRFQALTNNLLPGFGNDGASRNQQVNISDTFTINATTQNEARVTYYREGQLTFLHPQHTNAVTNSCTGAASAYCFNGNTDTPLYTFDSDGNQNGQIANTPKLGITPGLPSSHTGVPFIDIDGGFSIGNDYEGELPQIGNSYSFTDNFSKVVGNHSLKAGVDFRIQHFDQTLYYNVSGYYSYTGGGSNDLEAADLFGNYLLGMPDNYSQGSPQTENIRAKALYLFAQDSWKIKPNLTMNYGLRWELNQPLADASQRVQTFRAGQVDTVFQNGDACVASGCSPATDPNYPVGLVIPGDKGVPNGLTSTYYKAFAPRIGLTWSPKFLHDKVLFRGGYGIFYNPIEQLVLEQFQGEPPFGGSSSVPEGLFQAPFVTQSGTTYPNAFNGFLNPKRGSAVEWENFRPILLYGELEPHLRSQYSEQYNFGLQEQLPGNMVFNLGFVGSQGHRLLATYDLNHADPQTCLDLNNIPSSGGCGPFSEDVIYNIPANSIPNGVTLHLPYGPQATVSGPNNPTIVLAGLRAHSSPNCNPIGGSGCPTDVPVFSNIFAQNTIANSNYNSLQASLEKRFSQGIQFEAAYTWSKSIDNASSFEQSLNPLNFSASRALSLFDARNRFVFSSVWDLPFRKYSGAKGLIANGWTASGIVAFQDGFPIRMQSSDDFDLQGSVDFESPGKPQINGPFTKLDPKKNGGYYFDTTVFSDAALGSTGNVPRSLCCGPGIDNTDLALEKATPLGEGRSFEFTAQFFNIFNHTQFLNPDGNFSDGSQFGRITRFRSPRQMQFAFRIKL